MTFNSSLQSLIKTVAFNVAFATALAAVLFVPEAYALDGMGGSTRLSGTGPLDEIVASITDSFSDTPFLFSVVAYLFGAFFILTGLFKLRNHIDNPNGEPLRAGLARLFGGGALMSAPTIALAIQDIISDGASGVPNNLPDGGSSTGLGQLINNVTESVQSPEAFFALIAYFFGVGFAIWAIIEFIKAGENSNQTPLRRPIMIAITSSALLALPDIIYALKDTFFLGLGAVGYGNINLPPSSGGGGLDQIFVSFISNMYDPMLILFQNIAWISGVAFALVGVFRLMKNAQEGPKSPVGMGTLATFATAAALTSVPTFMGVAQESIFNTSTVSTYAILASDAGNADIIARANQAILAVFLFVRIVGWFSFVRGIFILRSVAEGGGQASMAAGFTHIIGGAIAVNLAAFVKAVQTTLGLTGLIIT